MWEHGQRKCGLGEVQEADLAKLQGMVIRDKVQEKAAQDQVLRVGRRASQDVSQSLVDSNHIALEMVLNWPNSISVNLPTTSIMDI